jgi:hypothetical protein
LAEQSANFDNEAEQEGGDDETGDGKDEAGDMV